MCELKLGNHPTVKLIDNQIDPEWIKETKELRNYLKDNNLSRVIFYQFDKDVADPTLDARINKEVNQMKQSGIPRMSVPKFLINGKEPQGRRDVENYSAIIEAELIKRK